MTPVSYGNVGKRVPLVVCYYLLRLAERLGYCIFWVACNLFGGPFNARFEPFSANEKLISFEHSSIRLLKGTHFHNQINQIKILF